MDTAVDSTRTYESPGAEPGGGPGPRLMTANTLTGDEVRNRNGDVLGKIDEIMIDVPRGKVAYAVMSSGGFLGLGTKLFAIPWSALTLDTANKCFVMDADPARFENAEGFDKDNWPSAPDTGWNERTYDYWGAKRYWE